MEMVGTAQDQTGTTYFINDTAQVTVDNTLRIGAGNIWQDEYVDPSGATVEGLTGGLWFFVRDQPDLNRHVRVHAGQSVEVAGYRVTILSVETGGIGISVQH